MPPKPVKRTSIIDMILRSGRLKGPDKSTTSLTRASSTPIDDASVHQSADSDGRGERRTSQILPPDEGLRGAEHYSQLLHTVTHREGACPNDIPCVDELQRGGRT